MYLKEKLSAFHNIFHAGWKEHIMHYAFLRFTHFDNWIEICNASNPAVYFGHSEAIRASFWLNIPISGSEMEFIALKRCTG